MNQSSNTISKEFIVTVNGSCVTLHPSHRHINKISLQQSQLSGKFKLLKSTRLFKFKKKTHRNHCSDGLCLEMKSFFVFPFQSMSVTTQKMITVILQLVTLGSGVSALPSKTVGLYIGCCCCLGAKPVWEAGTCCKTASRGTLRAKVVSFCPDSLAPVQAIGRLPI